MARAEARQVAMQLIYEHMLGGGGGDASQTMLNLLGFSPSGDDDEYIRSVVAGVSEHERTIDDTLSKYLVNWSINRLARVDLAILRLATFEILHRADVPRAVSVNEAVELSRVYSTEEASGFINGVLGTLIRLEQP